MNAFKPETFRANRMWRVVWLACLLVAGARACGPNQYGPHCRACPPHTTCAPGSQTAHDCKCEAGFVCMYFKQVRAVVTLNTTLYAFNSDAEGVRSRFVEGMAAAGGVPAAQVTIGSVRAASMRRSLGGPSSVQVSVLLSGAGGLTAVPHHLGELHLDDAWEVDPQVRVFALAGQAPARRI